MSLESTATPPARPETRPGHVTLDGGRRARDPHLIRSGALAHRLTDEERRRGGLTRQAQLRTEREERRRRLEAVLDAKLEALADALIAKALEGDVAALREAIHQLVGRPTEVVSGHPERPVRVVVESISSRRREALADVEADAAEVEELPPGAT